MGGAAGADGVLARVRARAAERFPADLERIRGYLRLPSVSATGEGIRETATATLDWVRGAGGDAELVQTGGHPLLVGELPGPPGAPRLLRYGMYDVQPAEEHVVAAAAFLLAFAREPAAAARHDQPAGAAGADR